MHSRSQFLQHIAQTSDMPLMLDVSHAEGHHLYDSSGKAYFDLIAGISVSHLGHRHPEVTRAIKEQVDKHWHVMVYGEFIQAPQIEFAEQLSSLLPDKLESTYFVNSGSEATEGALKLAKRYTGRPNILAFDNAYHGSTFGALSVAGNESMKNNFRPLLPGVSIQGFNDPSSVNAIDANTAAVIVETIQGEAGARVPDPAFLQALRDECDKTGALLIIDEIQAAFGRSGHLFAFNHFGIKPDILLLGKALGGGMPIGAFISSKKIMDALTHDPVLGHISTFGGHPLPCVAGQKALDVLLENKLIEEVPFKEQRFRENLEGQEGIQAIHGKGLMLAVEIGNFEKVKAVIHHLFERQIISDWFVFNNHCIRVAPPLTITYQEIDDLSDAILSSVQEAS